MGTMPALDREGESFSMHKRISGLVFAGLLFLMGMPASAEVAGSMVIAGHGPEQRMMESLARAFEKANPRAYLDVVWDDNSKPVEMVKAKQAQIEAAKHLGVKPSTVQRWIRKGCPVQSLGAVGRNKGSLVNLDEVNRWRSRRCGATSVQRDNESILAMIETALVDTLKRDQAHERVEIHRGLASGLLALAYQRIWQNLTRRSLDEFVLPPEIAQLCVIWLEYIETRHTTYRR